MLSRSISKRRVSDGAHGDIKSSQNHGLRRRSRIARIKREFSTEHFPFARMYWNEISGLRYVHDVSEPTSRVCSLLPGSRKVRASPASWAETMKFSNSRGFRRALSIFVATAFSFQGAVIGAAKPVHKHATPHKAATKAPVHFTPPPFLSMDVATGRIIEARDATRRWYPASVTKLMTVYVALQAVREGRLTLDTPLIVSARAASMKPSKMGFAPGSLVTLNNALKMLMVKSANDIAVTVAEGVSGSVEAFAQEMNETAAKLGMHESHFVNPNGLADPNHYSSARDMAILGRALLLNFPQYASLFSIGAMQIGEQVIPNHNGLIGRYPGADGMKTGYTCPAGFNLVASATRDGRKVVVVVMGDISAKVRTAHAADLLDRAFAAQQLGQSATDLPSADGAPPDLHTAICGGRSAKAQLLAETEDFSAPIHAASDATPSTPGKGAAIASLPRPVFDPVPVFVGETPGYQGPIAGPRPANTPIGAIAYTAPEHAATPSPVRPDPKALSMHRGVKGEHKAKNATKPAKQSGKKADKAKGKDGHAHSKSANGPTAKKAVKNSDSSAGSKNQAKSN